jgi:hypothetical protein
LALRKPSERIHPRQFPEGLGTVDSRNFGPWLGFGLEQSKKGKKGGESLPASWDGSPPGAVEGGCGGRTRTLGHRQLWAGGELGGACRCGVVGCSMRPGRV